MTTDFFDECTTDITMPQGWKDISYKNDACPSWSFNGYQVFIHHPDPNERECGSETSRFCVMLEKSTVKIKHGFIAVTRGKRF